MKRIILFGASATGKVAYNHYSKCKDIEILYFCDNDKNKKGKSFCNIEVILPEDLQSIEFDEIRISSMFDDQIVEQLLQLGIEKDKIFRPISNYEEDMFGNGRKLDLAHDVLFYITNLLNQYDIAYYIDHGTLLGIIRDQTILPWDVDVDIATPAKEIEKIIKILDEKLAFFKSQYCSDNNWKYKLIYETNLEKTLHNKKELIVIKIFNESSDNDCSVDIYPKYLLDDELLWSINQRRLACKKNLVFPLKSIVFKDKVLKIPNQKEAYLENLYGDWKVPVKEWSLNRFNNIKGK